MPGLPGGSALPWRAGARNFRRCWTLSPPNGNGPVRLVHGNLHPGNVLRGGPGRGVVAIDPRPCLGDPAFDAVDWVLASGDAEAAVRNRIDRLAGYLDEVDADRVWAWCRGWRWLWPSAC